MSNLGWSDGDENLNQGGPKFLPNLTRGQALGSVAELTMYDNPISSIGKYLEITSAERNDSRPELSPEELNDMYPDLAEPFQEPKKPAVAQIIANRQRYRQELQKNIASGPQDGLQTGLQFGTGLAAGLLDPTVVALGYSAELALLRASRLGYVGQMASQAGVRGSAARGVQYLGKPGLLPTATRDVVAGVGEGAVTEGIVAASNLQDMTPYTTEDFLMNTAVGAIAFPALMGSVRLGARGVKKGLQLAAPRAINDFVAKFDDLGTSLILGSNQALRHGIEPDFNAHIRIHNAEMDGAMPKFAAKESVEFKKLDLDNLVTGKVYAVLNGKNESGPLSYNFEFDDTINVTDSPIVANGSAGSNFNSKYNKIQELNITDEIKLAKFTDEYKDGQTIGERFNEIREDIRVNEGDPEQIREFFKELEDRGFDGMGGSLRDIDDAKIHDHNVMTIWNGDKLEIGAKHKPDKEAVGDTKKAVADEIENRQKQLMEVDKTTLDDIRAMIDQDKKDAVNLEDPEGYDKFINERLEVLEELERVEALTPEDAAELESIRANIAEVEEIENMLESAMRCVGRE